MSVCLIARLLSVQVIAGERLWSEFRRILSGRHVAKVVTSMADVGVLAHLGNRNFLHYNDSIPLHYMLQASRKMRRSRSFAKFVKFLRHLILTSQLDLLGCALTMKRF